MPDGGGSSPQISTAQFRVFFSHVLIVQTLNVADPEKQVHLIEARFQTHRLLATTPEDESTTSSTRATAIYQNVVWLCLAVLSLKKNDKERGKKVGHQFLLNC